MARPAPTVTRAEIASNVTDAELRQLIQDKKDEGATDCRVEIQGGKRFLVVTWPAPPTRPGPGG